MMINFNNVLLQYDQEIRMYFDLIIRLSFILFAYIGIEII